MIHPAQPGMSPALQQHGHPPKRMQWVAWGLGGLANDMTNVITALALPIYSIAFGLNPGLVGLAMAIPRVWDAFTDPVAGSISDNLRTRWGRRRPMILIGGIAMAVVFPLIWIPPAALQGHTLFAYLLGMLILFYTCQTVWLVPWNALGLELSPDYHERTKIQAIRAAVASGANFLVPWAYLACFWFSPGGSEREGVVYVGLAVGLIFLLTALPSAVFCREVNPDTAAPKMPFFHALGATLRNRQFLLLMGAVALFLIGYLMVLSMALYINIHHVFGGSKADAAAFQGIGGTVNAIASLASVPLAAWLAGRFGKRAALITGLCLVCIGKLLSWWLFNPALPWLQFGYFLLIGPGIAFLWILVPSILADICDDDTKVTGHHRQGMFSAVYTWVVKASVAASLILGGWLIALAGLRGGDEVPTPGNIFTLRLLFSIVPVLSILAAVVCVWKTRDARPATSQPQEGAP
jgi:GPH family glycoside/pentoside/hexuronide:cation symporter